MYSIKRPDVCYYCGFSAEQGKSIFIAVVDGENIVSIGIEANNGICIYLGFISGWVTARNYLDGLQTIPV